jgi:NAD-specific glutamate dehydrogenase
LRLLGGDDGVARDELRHDAAHGLDTARQRVDIQEQDVLDIIAAVTTQDATLQRVDMRVDETWIRCRTKLQV